MKWFKRRQRGLPEHDAPRVLWSNSSVSVICPKCERSFALADANGHVLSGVEEAIVVKEGLSLDRRFKLTCPRCGTKWLDQVPDAAGDALLQVRIEVGMTKGNVSRLLGEPHAKTTGDELLAKYRPIVHGSAKGFLNQEWWRYNGFPSEGMVTTIAFLRGRVSEINSESRGRGS